MALSGAGFRSRASRLVRAPWPAHQLAVAVRTDAVQRIGTRRAERALVAADIRGVLLGGERPRAALAAFAHFQSHDRFPLSRLVEQFATDQHPANLVPWAIWPRPRLRGLTFAALMLASSDRPKVLSRLVEQFATDQHPANLRRTSADLIQLGIPPQATGGIVVDVAVTTQRLDRLAGHPCGFFRSIEYRAGRILARGFAAVARLSERVHVRLARVHGRIHVRDFALHELEFADRLAELLSLVDVGQHDVHARCHDAQRSAREHRTLVVEAAHEHIDSLPFLGEYVFRG